jgi:hypothetical protein
MEKKGLTIVHRRNEGAVHIGNGDEKRWVCQSSVSLDLNRCDSAKYIFAQFSSLPLYN